MDLELITNSFPKLLAATSTTLKLLSLSLVIGLLKNPYLKKQK